MYSAEVLIIGAGPTGLVLALWLAKCGISVRIIDKTDRPGTTSRALVIHSRSLEFYQQLGIAHIAVEKGVEMKEGNIWVGGKKAGHLPFGDFRANISPFQFMLIFPQDQQEEMLEKELAKLGVMVERSTELISFEQSKDGIRATLSKRDGIKEQVEALYLAGCDGASSTVRESLKIEFPGGTYEEIFYVADLKAKGIEPGKLNVAFDEADFLAIFPMESTDSIRLVGTIRPDAVNKKDIKWEDVNAGIIKRLQIEVQEVKWFSTYKVHHRVALHFRNNNVFLLGDAAHIHSPIGGQGMNTGIGDAVNLAWKLGAVIKNKAPVALLDTYEPERIAFAQRLVATTDNGFAFVTKRGQLATWIRIRIAPRLLPRLFKFEAMCRFLFRTLSQTSIKYPQSALSEGCAGTIKGGDRLPWVKLDDGSDNFAALVTLKWQAHIYDNAPAGVQELCNSRGLELHIFPWNDAAKSAGLKKNAVYIIRPDGYTGLAEQNGDTTKITAYLNKWNIGPV